VAHAGEFVSRCFGHRDRQFGMGDGGREQYDCETGEQGFPGDGAQPSWGFAFKSKAVHCLEFRSASRWMAGNY
jgi:hypothetical protein